jgi:hypothetical protein
MYRCIFGAKAEQGQDANGAAVVRAGRRSSRRAVWCFSKRELPGAVYGVRLLPAAFGAALFDGGAQVGGVGHG